MGHLNLGAYICIEMREGGDKGVVSGGRANRDSRHMCLPLAHCLPVMFDKAQVSTSYRPSDPHFQITPAGLLVIASVSVLPSIFHQSCVQCVQNTRTFKKLEPFIERYLC